MVTEKVAEGVFSINKPLGMSSAQVIRDAQERLNPSKLFASWIQAEKERRAREPNQQKKRRKQIKREIQVKMGHGGTLDPLATGVLILGVGSGTKSLQSFLECTKTYETVVLFGASTDSYDRCGRILLQRPYEHITKESVLKALDDFRGTTKQIPPLYSALKMNGKPLYEYAREGKPIPREIPSREVRVEELELLEWYEPGTHKFRWPTEKANAAETKLAAQVWKLNEPGNGSQEPATSSEDEERELEALAAHESTKRRFEQSFDSLIRDRPGHKMQPKPGKIPMMSGALGGNPEAEKEVARKEAAKAAKVKTTEAEAVNKAKAVSILNNQDPNPTRGHNLVPEVDYSQPPPWKGKGPAAARIRLTVTSGFYVRSFCHDLGLKVGSVGLMAELCRSRQSDFVLNTPTVLEYDDLMKGEEVWGPQVAQMLERWEQKQIDKVGGKPASGKVIVGHNLNNGYTNCTVNGHANGTSEQRGEKRKLVEDSGKQHEAEPVIKKEKIEVKAEDKETQCQSDSEKTWNGISD